MLGLSVEEFAPAVAALPDYEELVLALVHPLVQVYTIPRTGQLAYVGHVCNFRQKVAKFLTVLPTLPGDMPFATVRPRLFRNRPTNRLPFKVNVHKLRHAFEWLKENNAFYQDIEWVKASEAQWEEAMAIFGKNQWFLISFFATCNHWLPIRFLETCKKHWFPISFLATCKNHWLRFIEISI